MGKSNRIDYLDALKGISILLVVFCHYPMLPDRTVAGNFFMTLAWLGVPCFMLVSGALYHQKKEFSFRKHFTKLGIMYLVFCFWRVLHVVLYLAKGASSVSPAKILGFIFFFQTVDEMNAGHMWYIVAYFFVMLFYPVSFYLFQNKTIGSVKGRTILLYAMGLCGLVGILLPSLQLLSGYLSRLIPSLAGPLSGINSLPMIRGYIHMLFYFFLGAFLFEYKDAISKKIGRKRVLLLPIALLACFAMMALKAIKTGSFFWEDIYLMKGYVRITTLFMSVATYLFFAEYGDRLRRFMHVLGTWVGQYTMGIFYMHVLILLILSHFVYPHLTGLYSFWLNCVKTLVVTAICVLLTIVMRKIPVIRKLVS